MAGADGSIQADAARVRLERIRDTVTRQIRDLVLALDTEKGASTVQRQQAANLTRIRSQVVAALDAAGAQAVDVAEQAVVDAAVAVARDVDLGDFTPDVSRQLELITTTQLRDVTATFTEGGERIRDALALGTTTSAELGEVVDAVAQAINTTFARAQAAVDAAIMGGGRFITITAAKETGVEGDPVVFLIVGPTDGKVREWCREHVGRAFSEDALDRDDNGAGQPKPVSVYLGGFNCRHSLAPMLASDARQQGIEVVL